MKMIDSHAHLYYDSFHNLDEVLNRAEEVGVSKIICIGTDLQSSEKCIELAEKYTQLYATVGVHPHDAKLSPVRYLNFLENFLHHPKVVALGEIGLDFHYNHSSQDIQKRVFRQQLELANSLEIPIVVHSRNSDDDLLSCIRETNSTNGVVHCFSSGVDTAKQLIEIGFYISFTGIVTFGNKETESVVKSVDLNNILIETDSPYLAPIPFRGKQNEPSYVKFVAEKIADLKNTTIEEVTRRTTTNTHKLFTKIQP